MFFVKGELRVGSPSETHLLSDRWIEFASVVGIAMQQCSGREPINTCLPLAFPTAHADIPDQ